MAPTVDGPADADLEKLGKSNIAQKLRYQAVQNRQEAAKLRARKKKLDADLFKVCSYLL